MEGAAPLTGMDIADRYSRALDSYRSGSGVSTPNFSRTRAGASPLRRSRFGSALVTGLSFAGVSILAIAAALFLRRLVPST